MGVNDHMQHANYEASNRQHVYRTPGRQSGGSPKRKLLLLGTCALIAGLALGLFALVSPTTPASAASPNNRGLLSSNPSTLDNLGTNQACGTDTHGGAAYVSCIITLKNTSNRNSVKWTASLSNTHWQLNPRSGKLAPNASVKVYLSEGGLACPDSSTITFSGPFNTIKVPVICNDIVVTPNKFNFSSKSCSKDNRSNWSCIVRVSADPKDSEPVQWKAEVTSSPAAAKAIKLFPANGTVSVEKRGRVTVDHSQFVKISIPASWGCKNATIFIFASGTPQISRFENVLTWSCPRAPR